MEKRALIVLLAVAVVMFLIGGGVATFLQSPKVEKVNTVVKALNSKTVTAISFYGKVSKIDGRNVTLSYSGDSVTVNVLPASQVYGISASTVKTDSKGVTTTTPGSTQQLVDFSTIKVGDNLNINAKMSPTGELTGTFVLIVPSFTVPTKK